MSRISIKDYMAPQAEKQSKGWIMVCAVLRQWFPWRVSVCILKGGYGLGTTRLELYRQQVTDWKFTELRYGRNTTNHQPDICGENFWGVEDDGREAGGDAALADHDQRRQQRA